MRIRNRIVLIGLSAALFFAGCAGAPVREEVATAEEGARIWSATCARCHNLRTATEFTAEQWTVIVNHMRTRQDLTRSEAQAVAAFLRASAERIPSSP